MKLIPYNSIDDLQFLPDYIQESLADRKELSHIRKLQDSYYVILRYPDLVNNHLNPICIVANDTETKFIFQENAIMNSKSLNAQSTINIINYSIRQYDAALEKIDMEIAEYERRMDELVQKEEIHKLFKLTRRLINYQIAIEAIEDTIDYIVDNKVPNLWNNTYAYEFANVQIELRQISKNIQTSVQIIDSILDVSESLFANILSKTVRTLTAITIVISIPTLITGYYSMNISLPHNEAPNLIIYIFIGSMIPTLLVFWFFRKKKYL